MAILTSASQQHEACSRVSLQLIEDIQVARVQLGQNITRLKNLHCVCEPPAVRLFRLHCLDPLHVRIAEAFMSAPYMRLTFMLVLRNCLW